MTQDEIVLFNLVDAYVARYGYGVSRIEADPGGAFHRVDLTNPERTGSKRLTVFADAVREAVHNRKLSDAIVLNLDSELRDGNGGTIGRLTGTHHKTACLLGSTANYFVLRVRTISAT